MDLDPSPEQRQLIDSLQSLLDKEATTERVRSAEPLGFDEPLWHALGAFGLPSMGVPDEAGGDGASMLDLALVAERIGSHLVPAPVVESVVAARLLARVAPEVLGEGFADGSRIATIALHPVEGPSPVEPRAGGPATPFLPGADQLVPGGAVAQLVLAVVGEELVALDAGPEAPRAAPANLGSAPLSRLRLPEVGRRVLAKGRRGRQELDRAVSEWKALTASALHGLARESLDIAVSYVSDRVQFGVPIGSFQAVQHRLADVATDLDGLRLLCLEAAWAFDEGMPAAPALASMAFAFAGEAAERATEASLHFHGGYGFMLENDVQLYYRRAKAWPLVYGDASEEYALLAELLYGPSRGHNWVG